MTGALTYKRGVRMAFATELEQAIKRELLIKQLVTLQVGRDDKGTPITQLNDRELALLIAVTKIRKGL